MYAQGLNVAFYGVPFFMSLYITKFYKECIDIKITFFCKIVCKLKYQQLE